MGKETPRNTRNSRSSAPYNVSNSSLRKKLADYISPTYWMQSWFDNGSTNNEEQSNNAALNTYVVQAEINHHEPPSLSSTVKSNHQNNVSSNSTNKSNNESTTNNIQQQGLLGNETCTPILNSERLSRHLSSQYHPEYSRIVSSSCNAPQPSDQSHKLFVSSTPAFNVNNKQTTSGDNGSESSDSTSGCSSFISQSNKMRGGIDINRTKRLFPDRKLPVEEISKTNRNTPQFDSSQLNCSSSSLNKSVTLSPFYHGMTSFGGASTYRKSLGLNKSNTSPSVFRPSLHRSLSKKPRDVSSPATMPQMSIVSENILKAINAMTSVSRITCLPTPEEANDIRPSLRGNAVKRKLPELQIPTVIDLLSVNRSERLSALSNPQKKDDNSSSSSSDSDLDYSIATNDTKRSLQQKIKRSRKARDSKDTEIQTDQDRGHCMPKVVLPLPSSLEMDLELSFSEPIDSEQIHDISNCSTVLSVSGSQEKTTADNSINFVYKESNLQPKVKSSFVPKSITLPPVEAAPPRWVSKPPVTSPSPKKHEPWQCHICNMKHTLGEVMCKGCNMPKTSKELRCINPPASKPQESPVSQSSSAVSTSNSLLESFKPPPGSWACDVCCVRNKAGDVACVSCTTPKPGAMPAADPLTKSLATPVQTATTTSSSSGFGDMFKKPTGNWECPACMISNNPSVDKCIACETSKPGSKPAPASGSKLMSGSKFPFTTSTADAPSFKFGIDKVDAKTTVTEKSESSSLSVTTSAPSFTFGMPSTAGSVLPSTSAPVFTFGIPKTSSTEPSTSSTVSVSSSSNNNLTDVAASSVDSNKSANSVTSSILSTSVKTDSPKSSLPTTSSNSQTSLSTNFTFANTNGPTSKPESVIPVEQSKETAKTSLFGTESAANSFFKDSPKPSLFGSSSTPSQNLFNKVDDSQKVTSGTGSLFGTVSATQINNVDSSDVSGPQAKKASFGLSNSDQPSNKFEFSKPASTEVSNNLFGSVETVEPQKSNLFSFSATNSTIPASTGVNEPSANSAFGSKPVESTTFTFGAKPIANAFPIQQKPATNSDVFTFGSSNSAPTAPVSSAQPFTFKPSSTGFNFGTGTTTPSFNNITSQEQQPSSGAVFGASAPSNGMFGVSNTQASSNPVFGSNIASSGFGVPNQQPTPSAAPFQFGAPSNNTNMFNFGTTQNSTPTVPQSNAGFSFNPPGSSVPTPTFNPNIRPSFNFTGGAVPSFNAAPQPGMLNSSASNRRIKKAVRRRT